MARRNLAHGKGNASSRSLLATHCSTVREGCVINGIGRWRSNKPANRILIQVALVTVGGDVRVSTGEARGVGSRGADRRVVIMMNRFERCVERGGCNFKVQRTVNGEKAIIVGIEW